MVKRAMVVLENNSGLPEDRVVNTWHFESTASGDAIRLALQDFYSPSAGDKIASFISGAIVRDNTKNQVRVYELSDPMPREPEVYPLTLAAPLSTVKLPNELSVCLSYHAGRNLKRQRGRIYIGPLTDAALLGAGETVDVRVSPALTQTIAASAAAMAASIIPWVVWSPSDGVARAVERGWVDNAFDIQRRRGAKATQRVVWNG